MKHKYLYVIENNYLIQYIIITEWIDNVTGKYVVRKPKCRTKKEINISQGFNSSDEAWDNHFKCLKANYEENESLIRQYREILEEIKKNIETSQTNRYRLFY